MTIGEISNKDPRKINRDRWFTRTATYDLLLSRSTNPFPSKFPFRKYSSKERAHHWNILSSIVITFNALRKKKKDWIVNEPDILDGRSVVAG